MKTYSGSCHCGAVQYDVKGDFSNAIECNCSMCRRKGTILGFTSSEALTVKSGKDILTDYQFYKKALHHNFCKTCGVTPFISGKDPHGNEMIAVNLRCLDGIDLGTVAIQQVDGKSF